MGELAEGELVVSSSAAALSRRGRSEVRARVVGSSSLGWLEVAEEWGARVELVVHGSAQDPVIKLWREHLTRIDYLSALKLEPVGPWNGIALATVDCEKGVDQLRELLCRWRPLIVILAVPSQCSRREMGRWTQLVNPTYKACKWRKSHQDLGGVTQSWWYVAHQTRDENLKTQGKDSLMTADTYPRTLQTTLDDTESAAGGGDV